MKRTVQAIGATAVLWAMSTGCALQLGGKTLNLDPMAAQREAEAKELQKQQEAERAEQDKVAQANRAEEERKRAAAAAEQKEKQKALEAKAKVHQKLLIPELGITVDVPGDVEAKPHKSTAYGDPALLLEGEASHFELILSNAESDRYDLTQRVKKHGSDFTYGIDVIRQDQQANGEWDFEYSYPIYFTDGSRGGNQMGYFSRKVVQGKKYNCFIAGITEKRLGDIVKTCATIAKAR